MDNKYFEHRNWHKYTRVARDLKRVEVKTIIELVFVKKDILHYVQDVKAVRGMKSQITMLYCVKSG